MNESAAREVVLVRAIEQADAERRVWNDEDRAWATRAAAEVVGAHSPEDAFLARRASLSIERLGARHPSVKRVLAATTWRPWIGWAVVMIAFAAGVATDQIGPAKRVNILAFPLIALLAWNLVVYAFIIVQALARLFGAAPTLGPLRGAIARLGRATAAPVNDRDPTLARGLATFAADWTQFSLPLASARVGRILHLGALAFALGAIAGMYVRGLALEYRAGWESTFLDAESVRRLLGPVLGPASKLTGIALPDATRLEAVRFSAGEGENAAPWLHLYAVTIGLVVLIPRALLALLAAFNERRLTFDFSMPREDTHAQRLVRQLRGESARVRVVPYAFDVTPEASQTLHSLLERAYGAKSSIDIASPVAWGAEDSVPKDVVPADAASVAALFSLSATPEPENHGAFLAALRSRLAAGTPLAAIIDESSFRKRFAQSPERLEERRAAWQRMLAEQRVAPVFLDLESPDLLAAESALNRAIERLPEIQA